MLNENLCAKMYMLHISESFWREGDEEEKEKCLNKYRYTHFCTSKFLAGSHEFWEVLGSASCVLIDRDDNDAPDSTEILPTVWQQAWKDITEGDDNEEQQEDIFQTARLGRYQPFDGTDWASHPCGCHFSFIKRPAETDTLYSTTEFCCSLRACKIFFMQQQVCRMINPQAGRKFEKQVTR